MPTSPSRITFQNGTISSTTCSRGASDAGTIFAVDPASGQQLVLYSSNGTDGNAPTAPLLSLGDVLYGSSLSADATDAGNVFTYSPPPRRKARSTPSKAPRMTPPIQWATWPQMGASCAAPASTAAPAISEPRLFSTIHPFQGGTDGANSTGVLIDAGGLLYGTTTQGGGPVCNDLGCGTLFKLDPVRMEEAVLHRFNTGIHAGHDGTCPWIGLTGLHRLLYGTTQCGGLPACVLGNGIICVGSSSP